MQLRTREKVSDNKKITVIARRSLLAGGEDRRPIRGGYWETQNGWEAAVQRNGPTKVGPSFSATTEAHIRENLPLADSTG